MVKRKRIQPEIPTTASHSDDPNWPLDGQSKQRIADREKKKEKANK